MSDLSDDKLLFFLRNKFYYFDAHRLKNAIKVFLNADSEMDDVDEDLANFLKYLRSGKPTDSFTKELDDSVRFARTNKEWKEEYRDMNMQRRVWEQNARNEGRNEGLTEGQDRVIRLIGHLSKDGKDFDYQKASSDAKYLEALFEEYKL